MNLLKQIKKFKLKQISRESNVSNKMKFSLYSEVLSTKLFNYVVYKKKKENFYINVINILGNHYPGNVKDRHKFPRSVLHLPWHRERISPRVKELSLSLSLSPHEFRARSNCVHAARYHFSENRFPKIVSRKWSNVAGLHLSSIK